MKNKLVISASVVVASLFVGCGGGSSSDGGSSGNFLTGNPVTVTTPQEATNAMSSVTTLNTLGTGSVSPSSARTASPSLAPVNESGSCVDGGSYSIDGDASDTTANLTTVYTNCSQYGSTMNGKQHIEGTNDGTTVNLDMTMTALSQSSSIGSSTMDMSIKYILNNATNVLDMTMNGTASFDYSSPVSNAGSAGYEDFRVVADNATNTLTINGDVSTTSSAHSCVDGRYHLETTQILVPGVNGFSSGQMKINGATFDFHNDGTATVTFADGSTNIVTQGAEVVCN